MGKFVEIGAPVPLADIVLVFDPGTEVRCRQIGFLRAFELGFEGLTGILHDGEVFSVDDGDIGFVRQFHSVS